MIKITPTRGDFFINKSNRLPADSIFRKTANNLLNTIFYYFFK